MQLASNDKTVGKLKLASFQSFLLERVWRVSQPLADGEEKKKRPKETGKKKTA